MIKASFSSHGAELDSAAVGARAAAARVELGRLTRTLSGTTKRHRKGRHAALSPEEKARRSAERRARSNARREEQETLVEAARARAARRRLEIEEERNTRWRVTVRLDPESRPKVTAVGGRKLERRPERFERTVVPHLPVRERRTGVVFRIKARSLHGEGPSRWRRGEAARFGRYLVRASGLEGSAAECVFTNIVGEHVPRGTDAFVQQLSGFLTSVEQLEAACGEEAQVYKSIIVPLPYEVGLEGRRRIAETFAAALRRRKLAFLIVLHAPDPDGDRRNTHMHIMVMTRTFERLADWEWQFAATKARDVFHRAMLPVWRRFTLTTLNRELERCRIERRYTLSGQEPHAEHQGRIATRDSRRSSDETLRQRERALDASVALQSVTSRILSAAVRIEAATRRVEKAGKAAVRRQLLAFELLVTTAAARRARLEQLLTVMIERARRQTAFIELRRQAGNTLDVVGGMRTALEQSQRRLVARLLHRAQLLRPRLALIAEQQASILNSAMLALHRDAAAKRTILARAFERTDNAGSRAELQMLASKTREAAGRLTEVETALGLGRSAALSNLRRRAHAARGSVEQVVAVVNQAAPASQADRVAGTKTIAAPTTTFVDATEVAVASATAPERSLISAGAVAEGTDLGRTPWNAPESERAEAKPAPEPLSPIPAPISSAPEPFDPRDLILKEKRRRERAVYESLRADEASSEAATSSFAASVVETAWQTASLIGQGLRSFVGRLRDTIAVPPKLEPIAPQAAAPTDISIGRGVAPKPETLPKNPLDAAVDRFDTRVAQMSDQARDAFGITIPLIRMAIRQNVAKMWFADGHIHVAAQDADTLALLSGLSKSPAGRTLLIDHETVGSVPAGWHGDRIAPNLALTKLDRSFHARGSREWAVDVLPMTERNSLVRAELTRSIGVNGTSATQLVALAEMLDSRDFRCSILITGSAERPLLRLAAADPADLATLQRIADTVAGRALLVRLGSLEMLGGHFPPLYWNDHAAAIPPDELAKAMPPAAQYVHWDGFDRLAHKATIEAAQLATERAGKGEQSQQRDRQRANRVPDTAVQMAQQNASVLEHAAFAQRNDRGR